jgi:hypothetical protein
MCDFIVDIKESQCKKRFCFLRWLLPLLSPISCNPIMFSNYLLMWQQPLRFFFCRFLSDYATGLFPLLAVVRRLPNLDFLHFQKFRLEEIRNGI